MARTADAVSEQTVTGFLEEHGVTPEEFAEAVGLEASTVRRRARDPQRNRMPDRWRNRFLDRGGDGAGVRGDTLPPADGGRAGDVTPPRRPDKAQVRREAPPADMGVIAGYIEGAYQLAGHTVAATDPALGLAIESHAAAAGKAWAAWIESEPKVKALLERMMVGTPLGEVVGVHVAIAFSYFMARGEMRRRLEQDVATQVAAADAAREAEANGRPAEPWLPPTPTDVTG